MNTAGTTAAAAANSSAAAPLPDDLVPRLGHGLRLQWEEVQGCHVLLYPEGMVKLNRSAGEILTRCDGEKSLAQIVTALETAFGATNLRGDVENFLRLAQQQRWLVLLGADGSAA